MQGKLHQYHPARALAKKYSHTTYLASPTDEPEHQVVLVAFTSSLFSSPHERKTLLQKAQRLKELQHRHLLSILDIGIEKEQPFIVRDYLPNGSLRSLLKEVSPQRLELRDALNIVLQVGEVLAYAHQHDILHGNIKPENIFLAANGQVVLTDFAVISGTDAMIRDQTTEEYAFCYMAPEQFTGTCDARSDQYALGCLTYELITGRVPFASQSLTSMMRRWSNVELAPLSDSVAGLAPSLETVVLKAMATDPDERFFDFSLFLEVVQSVLLLPPAFPLLPSVDSRKQRTTSRPMRQPKARTFLSSAVPPSPTPQSLQAETIQQPEELIPMTTTSVFDSYQTDTKLYVYQKTTNDGTRKSSTDRVRKPRVGEISFSEAHNDLDQTNSQEDADDVWLTNLFEEQESNDLSATGSASLGHGQHEPGREKKYEMILSLHRDRPVSRRTLPNKSTVLGLALLCFVIVASGMYAAFFPWRTSKPERLFPKATHVVNQVHIPVQKGISPAQPATPTATAQPTPQITTIPAVIPTSTPIPRPVGRQILAIDDSIQGTDLNQFNYVSSSDWRHTSNNCQANPCEYNNSKSWDHTSNDYVTLSFTGIQITLRTVMGPGGGIGAVSLDRGSETTIDTYAANRTADTLQWTSPTLPAGTHTFKLRVTGTKNPSSTSSYINVDRVDILS